MNTIALSEYTKRIKRTIVLDHITLSLEANRIYGIVGANGSGKTMLLRALAGLIVPTQGSVSIFGRELGKKISFFPSMGILIENIGLWDDLTGMENLGLLASIKKEATVEDQKRALLRVGLDPEDRRKYKAYSLGMKQKLGIAQAIMEKPQLLLLDEPTNALDEEAIQLVRNIILEEKERGATIFLASHNKEDLMLLADLTYRMRDGKCSPEENSQ